MPTSSSGGGCDVDVDADDGGAWDDDDDLLAMLSDDGGDNGDTNANSNNNDIGEEAVVGDQHGISGDATSHSFTSPPSDDIMKVQIQAATLPSTSHAAAAENNCHVGIINNGWDDDADLDLDLNENHQLQVVPATNTSIAGSVSIPIENTTATQSNTANDTSETVEEWDFDEDEDIFNENNLGLGDVVDEEDGKLRYSSKDMPRPQPPWPYLPQPPQPPMHSSTAASVPNNINSWQTMQNVNTIRPQQQVCDEKVETFIDSNENINRKNDNSIMGVDDDNDAAGAAGWSDDEFCFDEDDEENEGGGVDDDDDDNDAEEDTDLNLTISSAPLPSMMIPPPPHPKPVPPSPFPAVQSPPVAHRTRSCHQRLQRSEQKAVFVVEEVAEEEVILPKEGIVPMKNPAQRRNYHMISRYIASLHDSNFVTRLHEKLHLYQQQHQQLLMKTGSGSGGGGGGSNAASDLRAYYAARPGLRKYTLGVELDRMEYTLVLTNGKRVCDNDVIRSYFGANEDGETSDDVGRGNKEDEDAITTEELLIRSANQSLLADLLVALTGAEEAMITQNGGDFDKGGSLFSDEECPNQDTMDREPTLLILSGPTLCMTSVAETCQFKVDLQCGFVEAVCSLAISIPYHDHNYNGGIPASSAVDNTDETQIANGRLVLARATVSVRFRPGGEGGDSNDEPTVQYAVRSVSPLLKPDSAILQKVAISLARDQDDPFFHNEYDADIDSNDGATDARDMFLLSHHLADSGLLVVSDHFDRLRDAAAAKSTGFRSALRQLDGVTNVSSKLQGLGRFGLALPSAEEIEAAEQEAEGAALHLPRPPPPPVADFRFRLSGNVVGGDSSRMQTVRSTELKLPPPPPPRRPPPPPVPPPPPLTSRTETSGKPRPILGGLLMSGLSRLAAAATQPDDQHHAHTGWEGPSGGGGGTGLTPPSSPPNSNEHTRNLSQDIPRLYRNEDDDHFNSDKRGGGNNTGTAQSATLPRPREKMDVLDHLAVAPNSTSHKPIVEEKNDGLVDDVHDDDAGWSDEEFDFDDGCDDGDATGGGGEEQAQVEKPATTKSSGAFDAPIDNKKGAGTEPTPIDVTTCREHPISVHDKRTVLNPPPPTPLSSSSKHQQHQPHQLSNNFQHSQRTFEEEFVMVLKEKIDAECQEMKEQGRMKRWTPISEDPILRQQLMEVMVAQIQS